MLITVIAKSGFEKLRGDFFDMTCEKRSNFTNEWLRDAYVRSSGYVPR